MKIVKLRQLTLHFSSYRLLPFIVIIANSYLHLKGPIPGFDVSGTVLSSPSPVSKFQPRDNIYALTSFSRQANARGITLIEESEIAKLPSGLGWAQGASVPMSALTAWQALFVKTTKLVAEEGDDRNENVRVLVIGGSGAVGIWAVQLAKWAGSHVVGVCGTNNVDFVEKLGVDEVIDYKVTGIEKWIGGKEDRKFDIVLDGVGGDSAKEAWKAVKKGGVLISIVQPIDELKPAEGVSEGAVGVFFIVEPNGEQLAKIGGLIESRKMESVVDSIWKFEEYEKAFEKVESGRARGKVVIEMTE